MMQLLRGLLILTVACVALSAEVALLEEPEEPQTNLEIEHELGASDDPQKIAEALNAGIASELNKSAIKTAEEAFGPVEAKDVWDEDKYGAISGEEREAFRYIKALKKHYEKMTGRKIEADLSVEPGTEHGNSEVTNTLKEMEALQDKMNNGKKPKLGDVVTIHSHQDFIKQLHKLLGESKYAFDGIPRVTARGGEAIKPKTVAPIGNMETTEEKARQEAMLASQNRGKVKAAKAEEALEKQEEQKMDIEAAEADLPNALMSLLQLNTDAEPADKTGFPTAKDEFTSEADKQAVKQKTADTVRKTPNTMAGLHARLHALEGFIKHHTSMTKEAILQKKESRAETDARHAKNADKIATEEAVADEAQEVQGINNPAEDPSQSLAREITCERNDDLKCLKKKAAELSTKSKLAKHRAYDLQRAAALSASKHSDSATQLNADNAAEQEMVFAAVMSGEADRAVTAVKQLLAGANKKEIHMKQLLREKLHREDPMNTPIGFDHLGRPYEGEKPVNREPGMTAPDGLHREGKVMGGHKEVMKAEQKKDPQPKEEVKADTEQKKDPQPKEDVKTDTAVSQEKPGDGSKAAKAVPISPSKKVEPDEMN